MRKMTPARRNTVGPEHSRHNLALLRWLRLGSWLDPVVIFLSSSTLLKIVVIVGLVEGWSISDTEVGVCFGWLATRYKN